MISYLVLVLDIPRLRVFLLVSTTTYYILIYQVAPVARGHYILDLEIIYLATDEILTSSNSPVT